MENTYLYVLLLPQMNEKRELGYMVKFGFSENFDNRMKMGYNQYHNYIEVLHLYEGNFTKDDETRIKQYFRERDCVFIRDEYLKFIPEVLEFFDTYNTTEKLKSKISQLPKISKNGRSYVVNNLYVECILNKCYPDLQLVDRQNMRGRLYKELRSYIPKEQIVYIQSTYNISEESLSKYVEDHTIDLSNVSNEIKELANEFCSLKNTSSRLKYLVKVSEECLSKEDLINFLNLIPERFKDYYINLGPDRIRANSFQESRLKEEWNKQNQEELEASEALVQDIIDYFKLGQRYTNPEIKVKLKELYQKYGYKKSAKAIDLKEYFYLKRVYISSKRKNGFEIQKKR